MQRLRLHSIILKHEAIAGTEPKAAREWLEATLRLHGRRYYLATPLACGCIEVELMDEREFIARLAAAEWASQMAQGARLQ